MNKLDKLQIAIAVHKAWRESTEGKTISDAKESFKNLTEEYKELDYMGIDTLQAMGYSFVPNSEPIPSGMKEADIEKEDLAQRIHELWNYKKLEQGWQPFDGEKEAKEKKIDEENKRHHLVDKAYADIEEKYKENNRITAKITLDKIKKQGFNVLVSKSLSQTNRNGSRKLDKIISKSVWSQLTILLGGVFTALILFTIVHLFWGDCFCSINCSFFKSLNYMFVNLFDAGSLNENEGNWFNSIVVIFGWLALGGLFIAILTNGYFERIKTIERGEARYELEGHCVIIGSDKMYLKIIRDIRSGNKQKELKTAPDACIVIFTTQKAEDVRQHMKAHLSNSEEENVFIYNGERTSEDHLSSLYIQQAASVFIIGEEDEYECDAQNIECLSLVQQILIYQTPKKQKVHKPCFLMLDDIKSYELMINHNVNSAWNHLFNVQFFNNFDSWSSYLFSPDYRGFELMSERIADHWNKGGCDCIRFVIVGFNRMGRAVLDQAIRTLQFGTDKMVKITMVDREADLALDKYKAAHPGFNHLRSLCNISIETCNADIESQEAKDLLIRYVDEKYSYILGITICFRQPTVSLYTAMNLPNAILLDNIPLLVRQHELNGLAKDIHSRDGKIYDSIAMFGMVTDSQYFFMERENKAKSIQEKYQLYCNILERTKAPNNKPWHHLADKDKWANRYKAESAGVMKLLLEMYSDNAIELSEDLQALVYISIMRDNQLIEKNKKNEVVSESVLSALLGGKYSEYCNNVEKWDNSKKDELFSILEYLAEAEHNRWMAERIISGWSYNKSRDNNLKLHHNIVPYNELDEGTKMYDRGGFI